MADAEQAPKDLFGFLDFYLVKKAPFQIPDAGREAIVRFGPWISVVILVLLAPLVLLALGIGTILIPFGGPSYAAGFGIATIALIVQVGLLVAALPGLFARKLSAWRLVVYSQIAGVLFSLLSGNFISAILGGLIGLYILFQVRTLYR